MWHFLKLTVWGLLRVFRFLPFLHRIIISANKIKSLSNSVKLNSWAVPSNHVAHNILHVMSIQYVASDLHTTARWPLEYACWRQFAVLWGDCKKISNCVFQCNHYHYCCLKSLKHSSDLYKLHRINSKNEHWLILRKMVLVLIFRGVTTQTRKVDKWQSQNSFAAAQKLWIKKTTVKYQEAGLGKMG